MKRAVALMLVVATYAPSPPSASGFAPAERLDDHVEIVVGVGHHVRGESVMHPL